ncbi:hypothetical protein HDU86_008047 [Geranomyces michiganensis]|nr:hypothetical protein HDU86_008047 [Geranomyces michiganensis]
MTSAIESLGRVSKDTSGLGWTGDEPDQQEYVEPLASSSPPPSPPPSCPSGSSAAPPPATSSPPAPNADWFVIANRRPSAVRSGIATPLNPPPRSSQPAGWRMGSLIRFVPGGMEHGGKPVKSTLPVQSSLNKRKHPELADHGFTFAPWRRGRRICTPSSKFSFGSGLTSPFSKFSFGSRHTSDLPFGECPSSLNRTKLTAQQPMPPPRKRQRRA